MIVYSQTVNSSPELPEIKGYKPQFRYEEPVEDEQQQVQQPIIIQVTQEPTQEVVEETKQEEAETPKIQTTGKSKRYSDRNQFLSDMTTAYTKALKLKGINPEYAKYLAIQDALESNFGKNYAGNWNFGNITVGSSGASYTEGRDHDGYGNPIINKFRNYNSLDDYVNNKIALLSGKRYRAFNGDLSGFYARVKAGGYAGDPKYVASLTKLYNQYYPVQAKFGLKLPNVLLMKKGKFIQKYNNGDPAFTQECAEFQNTMLRDAGYKTSGNAWNLNNADLVYSGYIAENKPTKYNKTKVQKYNWAAAKKLSNEFDTSQLDTNKVYVANMYYNGSPFQETAYNQGRDSITGTHTGYVQFDPDTNQWMVTHNIHGTVHVDPLSNISGKQYGVTAIYQPKEKNILDKAIDLGKKFYNSKLIHNIPNIQEK